MKSPSLTKEVERMGRRMALGCTRWIFFFSLLLLMCGHGNGVRQRSEHNWQKSQHLKTKNLDDNKILLVGGQHFINNEAMMNKNQKHAQPSTHMDHMEASKMGFFTLKDLYVGKTLPIYFPSIEPSSSPHFLPSEEADSIPFTLKELPNLLHLFSISQSSPQAKAIKETLTQCEAKPIKGETKFCATSLESMLDFIRGIFSLETHFEVLTTTHLRKSPTLQYNYTILEVPKEVFAPKIVACHPMPYPYAVFYCHSQESGNKVFKTSLGGENGDEVEAVAVCHMDTSSWNPDHISFRLLAVKPGSSPVCHFFPANHLLWVVSPTI